MKLSLIVCCSQWPCALMCLKCPRPLLDAMPMATLHPSLSDDNKKHRWASNSPEDLLERTTDNDLWVKRWTRLVVKGVQSLL